MARETPKRAETAAAELRQVLGALTRRLRAESAGDELNPSETAVLRRLLDQGPATTAALARAEWVKPQSMGATVAGLEERGLVARNADAADARCRVISLTERGTSLLQAGRAARQNWLAIRIAQTLEAEEQKALVDAIELLRRVVAS